MKSCDLESFWKFQKNRKVIFTCKNKSLQANFHTSLFIIVAKIRYAEEFKHASILNTNHTNEMV